MWNNLSFPLDSVEIPGDKIFLSNYSSTELEISWPQRVNKKASSYLIYTWPVGSEQPRASDHLYHPINWRESFTMRALRDLLPGVEYNIRIDVTGVGDQLHAKLRTSKFFVIGVLKITPTWLTNKLKLDTNEWRITILLNKVHIFPFVIPVTYIDCVF